MKIRKFLVVYSLYFTLLQCVRKWQNFDTTCSHLVSAYHLFSSHTVMFCLSSLFFLLMCEILFISSHQSFIVFDQKEVLQWRDFTSSSWRFVAEMGLTCTARQWRPT